jgi:hypothetical protein
VVKDWRLSVAVIPERVCAAGLDCGASLIPPAPQLEGGCGADGNAFSGV